jgi:alkanesulfonate monooxygenase SsuD/methylene tetrahydromethanopterin reductase-like flavin-dependent oxidoreductase (luciferase family)
MKGQEGPVPKTHEQMIKSGFDIVGTPDTVRKEIQRLKDELNVEYMIFIMYGGIVEQRRMLDSIRLFGEHVIPHFPDAAPAAAAEAALVG